MIKSMLILLVQFPILFVIKILMTLLGLLVVPLALLFSYEINPAPKWDRAAKRLVYTGWTFVSLPKWAQWCWGSDKYGARGNWFWITKHPNTKAFFPMYEWLALRNACSNLNNHLTYTYEYAHTDIKYIGTRHIDDNHGITGIRYAWNGWRGSFTVLLKYPGTNRYFWWRAGYKHTPADSGKSTAVFATTLPNPFKKI